MKTLFLLSFCIILFPLQSIAQKFVSQNGEVSFFSDAAIEDITATNKKTVSILDVSTGDIAFSIPIKEFKFDQSLMEEHFNEKYLESDKYPKAIFQGKVAGLNAADKNPQNVTAKGKLTIHGVTKEVEVPGTIQLLDDDAKLNTKFIVKLEDYKVEIPKLLWEKIAEQVEVTLNVAYKAKASK